RKKFTITREQLRKVSSPSRPACRPESSPAAIDRPLSHPPNHPASHLPHNLSNRLHPYPATSLPAYPATSRLNQRSTPPPTPPQGLTLGHAVTHSQRSGPGPQAGGIRARLLSVRA